MGEVGWGYGVCHEGRRVVRRELSGRVGDHEVGSFDGSLGILDGTGSKTEFFDGSLCEPSAGACGACVDADVVRTAEGCQGPELGPSLIPRTDDADGSHVTMHQMLCRHAPECSGPPGSQLVATATATT